jgi:hypothetical protein
MTLDASVLFDANYYLAQNPDVADAISRGAISSALDHFTRFGQFELRNPSPFFNNQFYLSQNPDIRAAFNANQGTATPFSPFQHFISSGQFEGRTPNYLFDPGFYLSRNPDVAALVGPGKPFSSAFEHFLRFGQSEQRDPSALFNTEFYLAQNSDVAQAGIPAARHFLQFGQFASEQRSPTNNFSFATYASNYSDVANATSQGQFTSLFEHFVRFGQQEARSGDPVGSPVFVIGGFDWQQENAASTATSFGSPGIFGPGIESIFATDFGRKLSSPLATQFDASRTTGRLLPAAPATSAALAATFPSPVIIGNPDLAPNRDRARLEITWNGQRLPNGPGDDFVIYESGFQGGPEAYAVEVRRAGQADFFPLARYEFADSFELFDPTTGAGVFATGFNLTDFGLGSTAQIDAIRISNIFNAAAGAGEDRIYASNNGQGFVGFNFGPEEGSRLTTGPLGPGGANSPFVGSPFDSNKLDVDTLYVAGLYDVTAPTA